VNRQPDPKKESTNLAPGSMVKINADTLHVELDGEIVILGLGTEQYYGLSAVGAQIWRLIQHDMTLEEVQQALQEEYDVPPAVLWQDLVQIVGTLVEERLVSVD